jgi:RsiW-degrading membrane proteinase PrsW (M82 family)
MACRNCGTDVAPGAWVCPACGRRLRSRLVESWAVVQEVLAGATATARGLRCGFLAAIGSAVVLPGLVTLAILALAVPSAAALAVSALAAAMPVPLYTLVILWLDRHEREPSWLLATALVWGAVVGNALAVVVNTAVSLLLLIRLGPEWSLLLAAPVVAPVVEESAKGAALLLIAWRLRHEFDNAVDGIVYGGLVGLGFAMTENVLYFGHAFLAGGLPGLGLLFLLRVVAAGFAHSMFTGMAGAGLGLARERPPGSGGWVLAVGGYLVGVGLHALWNLIATLETIQGHPIRAVAVDVVVLLLPGVWTLLGILYFGWRRERRVIAEHLAAEIASGVVLAEELAVLTGPRARSRTLWRTLRARGPLAWYARRQLYDLEIQLAFRNWHAARGEQPPPALGVWTPAQYRDRIAAVRRRLAAEGPALPLGPSAA